MRFIYYFVAGLYLIYNPKPILRVLINDLHYANNIK